MAFALEFFLRRISQGVLIVLAVAFVIFTLLRIAPGDPTRIILGPMATPSAMEETAQRLGLRDPIPVQFLRYLGDIAKGDFGNSFIRGKQGGTTGGSQDAGSAAPVERAAVIELIARALPYTLLLAACGFLLACLVSIPLGILAGVRNRGWPQKTALYLSSFFVSLPNVWVGIVLIYLLSARTGWLPAIGYQHIGYVIIPAIVVAVELAPVMIRSISVALAGNVQEPFYEIGQVRGLSARAMLFRHVLRNAAVPLLNSFGAQMIGMLLGGLFVVEYIFSFPGIGLLTINAVFQRDFPVIQTVAIFASTVLVFINIAVDFASTTIDRRLKF
ncbi:ABC transporter permease [Aquamicrobium sp. NLF2-7]|uniref:ABC transporter permease n=1 Tax=Aquamicrobium sp. NLF2-7 TaxID=2918753 RepID=UPI001EFBAAF7|nr:ABC transporter permease [Aquamicrobium sp. NLF2-7]MCG8274365.1 ABC transporter permease [Aquamicrobium sp. NLF2-7]